MTQTKLFSTFRTQSTPDFFEAEHTMACEARRVCTLKMSPQDKKTSHRRFNGTTVFFSNKRWLDIEIPVDLGDEY
jgi:hypothetical protein